MEKKRVIQGRETTDGDINLVKGLIEDNPNWNRTRISRELCLVWNWRASNGQLKDMACRSFLLKLEKLGYIALPPRQLSSVGGNKKHSIPYISHETIPISCNLSSITPIRINRIENSELLSFFKYMLFNYHYLGFCGTVGENMKYIVFDVNGNPLSCLLFGSAALKCAPRDSFIGWNSDIRKDKLAFVTNNMRFLIFPWVKVSHLASHILGAIAHRISFDWQEKYGHPIYILETFVDRERFRGICYRAANWIYVGQTKGRSRNYRFSTMKVPVKDIYLYPLSRRFREVLRYEV